MPKKEVKPLKTVRKNVSSGNIDKALIDNFIALQRVMTNLSLKFDDLSKKITKLLDLFEISAKTIVEKDYDLQDGSSKKETNELVVKLDKLLDQNRIIAKGLSLLHDGPSENQEEESKETVPEKVGGIAPQQNPSVVSENDDKKGSTINMRDYEKSISAKPDSGENRSNNQNPESKYESNENFQ